MNKLPTKQIYLLAVIIVGIIALSVYSTYAIFTYESSTSDIVSIHTPKSLQISENIYEYQQVIVEPNSITTTDIDIYNTLENDVCYSIWYKVVGEPDLESKVQVFEYGEGTLTTSGVLNELTSLRITIAIINDNNKQIKVNIGSIGNEKQNENCSLNISPDKKTISTTHNTLKTLSEKLLEDIYKLKESSPSYLTYKDEKRINTYQDNDYIYISSKFKYNDETFSLQEPVRISIKELYEKKYLENQNIYFCEDNEECRVLYKVTKLEKSKTDEKKYNLVLYDKLIGYKEGQSGLRKTTDNNYVYYGDNPDNFIYYNCKYNEDISTCELWRIIGLIYNNQTNKYNIKLIKNDSIGTHQYDSKNISNRWEETTLYKYLNEEYQLINNYDSYIEEYMQNRESIETLDTELNNIKVEGDAFTNKVSLISLSDYLYSSSCQKDKINDYTTECFTNNWLNNNEISKEWTITTKRTLLEQNSENEEVISNSEIIKNNNINNYVYSISPDITETNIIEMHEVRPVIFLKSRMLFVSGNGTIENPYIVK